jgi:hypothetical protein
MADGEPTEVKTSKPLTMAGELLLFKLIGLSALAKALDSKQARTSFGKLPLSVEKTQPIFGFPQAKRGETDKIYMGELTKLSNAGKQSPGPIYHYEVVHKYNNVRETE